MLIADVENNGMVPIRYRHCNTQQVVSRTEPKRYALQMDIRTIRRTNFEALIEEAGGLAPLAKRSSVSEKYLRNIYNGFVSPGAKSPKQVGDKTARSLEEGMGKPWGWMDIDHSEKDKPSLGDVLGAPIFPLVCPECHKVSHKSFVELEMHDRLPCGTCGVVFNINNQYGHGELKMFLEALGYRGFSLRQQRKLD